jgi:hypothetical protein
MTIHKPRHPLCTTLALLIAANQRKGTELGFKEGIPFVPVYLVTNIYPVILSSFRKSYILYEVGSAVSTFHFE